MKYFTANLSAHRRALLVAGLSLCLGWGLVSCGGGDQSESTAKQASTQAKPDAAAAEKQTQERPAWTLSMRNWPDTVRWSLDSDFNYTVDDLRFRLIMNVSQDVSEVRFQNERPLVTEALMIVSPVPEWRFARGLSLDSIVYYDTVKKRALQGQPMLSWQRSFDESIVRTEYLPNLAERFRMSPTLEEGQQLKPVVYLTWDDRTFIIETPPLTLEYVREPKIRPDVPEPPPDYREGMQTPG